MFKIQSITTDDSESEGSDAGGVTIPEAKPGKGGSDDGHDGHIMNFTEVSDKNTERSKERSYENTGGSATTTPVTNRGLGKATSGNINARTKGVLVTPGKRRSANKKGKSVRFLIESEDETESNAAGVGPIERAPIQANHAPENVVAARREIPYSWKGLNETDQMLITMKENGKDLKKIREAWIARTGLEMASSKLLDRCKRIKLDRMEFREGDAERLLAAKTEVERCLLAEKCSMIADHIYENGGAMYPALFVQKKLEELESHLQRQPAPKRESTITRDANIKEEDAAEG